MIEFIKPTQLDGNVLEAELANVGIVLPEHSIFVFGEKLMLPIDETQRAAAQAVIDSIYG
jgi:hypothetical protein